VQLQSVRGRLGRQAAVQLLEARQRITEDVVEDAGGLQAVDGLVAAVDEDAWCAVDVGSGDGDRPVGAVGLHLQTGRITQVDMTAVVDHHGARRIAEHHCSTSEQTHPRIPRDRPEVLGLADSPAEAVEADVATDGSRAFALVAREVGVAFDDGVEAVAVLCEVHRVRCRSGRCQGGVGGCDSQTGQKTGGDHDRDPVSGELFQGSPPP